MQILVVITLAMALAAAEPNLLALPPAWTAPLDTAGRAAATGASAVAMAIACLLYNLLTARRLDRGRSVNRRRYLRGLWLLAWVMVLVFAAQLLYLDWPAVVFARPTVGRIPVLPQLAVWAPFGAMVLGFWCSAYLVDVRFRLADLHKRLALGLPAYAPGGADRAVWGLGRFLAFQARFHLLLVLLPLIALLAARAALDASFAWLDPRLALRGWSGAQQNLLEGAAWLAAVVAIFVASPAVLAVVFSTRPMPAGPLLDQLRAALARGRVRVRRILLWRTGGMVSNAAVMGLWGRLRYVLLSDGLLETLGDEQIEGVFGHELGHVIHRHVIYYICFIAATVAWIDLARSAVWALPAVHRLAVAHPAFDAPAQALLVLLLAVAALFLFGWVSRNFERQADLTGAQMIALGRLAGSNLLPGPSADPSDDPPDDKPALGQPPHPAAAEIYVAALFRIAEVNGIDRSQRTWRHGSILSRGQWLRTLCEPAAFSRFTAAISLIKFATVALLAGAIAAAVFAP